MLSITDFQAINYITNSENSEELIEQILKDFTNKNPKNIVRLSDYIKLLHDIKVSNLVKENVEKYQAIEWLSHYFQENEFKKHSCIGAHKALRILFPNPLKWNDTNHSVATKNFFCKFMALYSEFRYDPNDKWFEEFSDKTWWEQIEKVYVAEFL